MYLYVYVTVGAGYAVHMYCGLHTVYVYCGIVDLMLEFLVSTRLEHSCVHALSTSTV